MRIIICDIHMELAEKLNQYLKKQNTDESIEVIASSSKALMDDLAGGLFDYPIAFIGISTPENGVEGIRLGRLLNVEYPNCQIIYIVDDYDCIPQVYEVNHCYLLRTSELDTWLPRAYEKALKQYRSRDAHNYLELICGRRPVILSQIAIIYVERIGRMVKIQTYDTAYETYTSIREIYAKLSDSFGRCHGSFIVNMDCVFQMAEHELILDSGEHIPVGRTYYQKFMEQYRRYRNMGR